MDINGEPATKKKSTCYASYHAMAARTDSLPSIYAFLFFLRGINLSVLAVEWYASVEHAIELFFLYFKESFKRFQLRNLLIAKLSN